MTLADGQVQLRDVVMGTDTSYRFVTSFNPLVRTVRAEHSERRAWNNGSWSGAEFASEVAIPMRLVTLGGGAAGWLSLRQALSAAFAPSHDDLELRFAIAGSEYVMYGRPRMVEPDARRLDGTGYIQAGFIALDPSIYSGVEHSQALVLPTQAGGLTVPVTAPITVDGTFTAGRATIANAGTATTGLRLRIDGPIVEPRVSLLSAGSPVSILRFTLTLTAGQWLDVDTARRTVYLNGTASRRGNAYGDWPLLPDGSSEIAFDSPTYDAGADLTVYWRDAWH